MNDAELKPGTKPDATTFPDYYYRMYRLKKGNDIYTNFGAIGFGKNKDGKLVTQWEPTKWINISGNGDDGVVLKDT